MRLSHWLPVLTAVVWWRAWNLYKESSMPLGQALDTDVDIDTPSNHSDIPYGVDDAPMPYPGASPDRILYFVHISDLHVSRYKRHVGAASLQRFLNTTVPMVRPPFFLVTGGTHNISINNGMFRFDGRQGFAQDFVAAI